MCGVEVRGKKCIKQRENFMQWKRGVSLWEKKEKKTFQSRTLIQNCTLVFDNSLGFSRTDLVPLSFFLSFFLSFSLSLFLSPFINLPLNGSPTNRQTNSSHKFKWSFSLFVEFQCFFLRPIAWDFSRSFSWEQTIFFIIFRCWWMRTRITWLLSKSRVMLKHWWLI